MTREKVMQERNKGITAGRCSDCLSVRCQVSWPIRGSDQTSCGTSGPAYQAVGPLVQDGGLCTRRM